MHDETEEPSAREEPGGARQRRQPWPEMIDEAEIRRTVARLARPHRSGGHVIERAAILAAGTDSTAILAWINAHEGRPEALPVKVSGRGLHSALLDDGGAEAMPRRYVLPPGVLS